MITERNSTNSTSSTTVLPQAKSGNAMESSFDPSSNHSTNSNNNNNNIASSAAERRLSANAKSNNILAAAAAATTAAGGAKNDSNLTEKLMLKSNQPNKGKADSAAADSVATEVVVANGGSAALLVLSSSSAELGAKSCNSKANEQKEGQLFYDGNQIEQHPALVEKKKENYSLNGSRAANHIETHLWAASASASARASFEEDLNTRKKHFFVFFYTHTLNRWAAHIYRQKEEEEEEIKNKRWCLKMISRWEKECLHLMHLSKNNGKRKKKFYSREKWKNYSKKSSCMQKNGRIVLAIQFKTEGLLAKLHSISFTFKNVNSWFFFFILIFPLSFFLFLLRTLLYNIFAIFK